MTSLCLEAARHYLALGYHPIPCMPKSKRPLVEWAKYQSEPPLADEIEMWFGEKWPDANVALVLGRGTFAVDLDGGHEAQALLFQRGVLLPAAPRSKTAHGAHVFLAGSVPDRVGLLTTNGKKPQVDIRGVGYVVAPPSIHPDGPCYEWVVPLTATLPAAPPELLRLLEEPDREPSIHVGGVGWVADTLEGVPEGQRDQACTRLAGYFLGRGLDDATVETILLHTFAIGCTPPAEPEMIRKCVRSISKRERSTEALDRPIAAQRLAEALAVWQREAAEPASIVRTPFDRLNRFLGGGFSAGQLIYIGARPGVGKTALALVFARTTAIEGRAVLIVSREMVNVALARRLVTQESGISTGSLKRNDPLAPEDAMAVRAAIHRLRPLPIWLSDEAVSLDEIAALLRVLHERMPLSLVLVDYLQLVRAPREVKDRRLQVEAVSQGLKALAVEYKLPVVCLSSLSRPEKGTVRRPTLADLRESGELEHDADVVLLLHRAMLEPETECIVAKNREGSPGIVRLNFDGPSLQFREALEVDSLSSSGRKDPA